MQKETLTIKSPILGFETTTSVELEVIDELFLKLKSLDGKDFTFVLIDPQKIRPGYDFIINEHYKQVLNIQNETKRQAFIIMALHEEIKDSTLNFLAPIVINWDEKSLAQVILEPVEYPDFFQADKISNYIKSE